MSQGRQQHSCILAAPASHFNCTGCSSGWLVGMLLVNAAAPTAGATGWRVGHCRPQRHLLGRAGPGSSSKGWGR